MARVGMNSALTKDPCKPGPARTGWAMGWKREPAQRTPWPGDACKPKHRIGGQRRGRGADLGQLRVPVCELARHIGVPKRHLALGVQQSPDFVAAKEEHSQGCPSRTPLSSCTLWTLRREMLQGRCGLTFSQLAAAAIQPHRPARGEQRALFSPEDAIPGSRNLNMHIHGATGQSAARQRHLCSVEAGRITSEAELSPAGMPA